MESGLSHVPPPSTPLPASPAAPGSCARAVPIGKSVVPGSAIAEAALTLPSAAAAAQSGEVGLTIPFQPPPSATDLTVPNFYQQMVRKTTAAIVILSSLITYVSVNSLIRAINPAAFIWYDEDNDESRWIASSRSWFDRKACRWLGACGTAHFRLVRPQFGQRRPAPEAPTSGDLAESASWRAFWLDGANQSGSSSWDEAERSRREIPDYVFQYAPLVHLFSGEQFWPCDIAEHLYHTTPMLNYTPVQSRWDHSTLQDLDRLNQWQKGRYVFLTSNDNVEERPPWMEGGKNIPGSPKDGLEQSWADWDGRVDGEIPGDSPAERAKWYDTNPPSPNQGEDLTPEDMGYLNADDLMADEEVREDLRKRYGGEPLRMQVTGGRSDAPAIVLVMDKGNGIVDAFWFYFYSFNLGNVVLNVRFGNHVGDWEHCLVRFHHGKPKALFFSAHSAGEAYNYEAVEKIGERVSAA